MWQRGFSHKNSSDSQEVSSQEVSGQTSFPLLSPSCPEKVVDSEEGYPRAEENGGHETKDNRCSTATTETDCTSPGSSLGILVEAPKEDPCNSNRKSVLALAFARVVHALQMRRLHDYLTQKTGFAATTENPIWLLGVCYKGGGGEEDEAAQHFLHDFSSRLWFTYRKDFPPLGDLKLTSDAGWGCMLRSGQMLLAQALLVHRLGRTFRHYPGEAHPREYLEIVRSFGDSPADDCPLSIHRIIDAGSRHGLAAGAWLGPYAFCRSLEALAAGRVVEGEAGGEEGSANGRLPAVPPTPSSALPLAIYVAAGDADGERGGAPVLLKDDVQELCSGEMEDGASGKREWGAVLVLVPLHLGLEKVNPRYLPSLQKALEFPQSVGVLGGKPGASTYLVGYQDDQVFYLDPHEVQPSTFVSVDDPEADTSSYHCSTVKRIPLETIDPSLALGFYCSTRVDFEDLCKRATALADESNGAPMFTVGRRKRDDGEPSPSVSTGKGDLYNDTSAETGVGEEDWQIL